MIAEVKNEGIGGRGRMLPCPGSWVPGTNTKRLFSINCGNSATSLANAWNDSLRV